jgi:alkanesulfonate monooxygenase SsuD/methylene tetrahydromethanopterin reductase-like flavin-dependent oxidoreductase (luciferase family)
MNRIPLSILDLAPISAGSDAATALRNTIDLAQHAEAWGYKRYWVAEHHFVAVASSQPTLLIGQIAAATSHIRVGAGAVQLGQTAAIAVAESFGMLDAFHPGRIDMGLGRSAGRRREAAKERREKPASPPWRVVDGLVIPTPFDLSVLAGNARLRAQGQVLQQPDAISPDFAEQVADIEALLDGTFSAGGHDIHAVPGERSGLTPWIFGSSKGKSARVAGARGLPFVASYHITPGTALDAIAAYREAFTPSAHLREPYVVVSADIVVADDSATARQLASSYGHWVYSIRTGDGALPYPAPEDCAPLDHQQREVVRDRTATQFVGDPDEVADKLETLRRVADADELVITSVTHGHADRLRSHELIAKRWGLTG